MDLAAVLDATEPVDVEFLDHKITAHVYTAGALRLTKEQRAVLRTIGSTIEVEGETGDETSDEQLSLEAVDQVYNKNVDTARLLIPIMVGKWDLDGSPMTYGAAALPPTAENMPRCPDALIMEVAVKAVEVWQRPTNGGRLQAGSPPEEIQPPNQTDSGATVN